MTDAEAGPGRSLGRPPERPGRTEPAVPAADHDVPVPAVATHEPGARDGLEDLVRRSGQGDEAAFAALYDATSATVYGLAVRVTRSPELAAEVVQETYLMAWQQSARFDASRGSVPAWLCTLAHRRAVDRIRQTAREREREQTYEQRRAETPTDQTWQEVEQTMDTHEVRAGLGHLTPLQREAVALAYYQGFTHQEVARRLDVPLGTAKARIRDGLTRLRSALGGQP
ncbi:ECF RNA polymerase sigma factor SigK [Arthrobacter saudimassiliensis]|uniref:ECF RNA polymerase sigma factor SigK n=1 Tax=Arthrobacter saudimassiliensis TaxID=1461584 RepID=A0A078MY92_9MICC|nr:ECF RNA polymerase sigma factor SigK [Arthrobacter saudimassiliensis]